MQGKTIKDIIISYAITWQWNGDDSMLHLSFRIWTAVQWLPLHLRLVIW